VYVPRETQRRFDDPTRGLGAVAVAGLAVDVIPLLLLRSGESESLNGRGPHPRCFHAGLGRGDHRAATVLMLTGWPT
jgi:hypothetical protein